MARSKRDNSAGWLLLALLGGAALLRRRNGHDALRWSETGPSGGVPPGATDPFVRNPAYAIDPNSGERVCKDAFGRPIPCPYPEPIAPRWMPTPLLAVRAALAPPPPPPGPVPSPTAPARMSDELDTLRAILVAMQEGHDFEIATPHVMAPPIAPAPPGGTQWVDGDGNPIAPPDASGGLNPIYGNAPQSFAVVNLPLGGKYGA